MPNKQLRRLAFKAIAAVAPFKIQAKIIETNPVDKFFDEVRFNDFLERLHQKQRNLFTLG